MFNLSDFPESETGSCRRKPIFPFTEISIDTLPQQNYIYFYTK